MADETKQANAQIEQPKTATRTIEDEQSDKLRIEQLVRENKRLSDELSACKALLSEQDAAMKSARTKKASESMPVTARALRRMLVGNRRSVEPGEALSKSDTEGLTVGEHYELVPVA